MNQLSTQGGAVQLQLDQFLLIYALLLLTAFIMKKCRVNQTKQLVIASIKMTVQLVIAGIILTYIFQNPSPVFTLLYLAAMTGFSIHRVLSKNRGLNKRFKAAIGFSISISGVAVLLYFICAVVREDIFNPQYTIPISGMIMGNTMTGVSLGVKNFTESLSEQRPKINALICIGASPRAILLPFVRQALETALLPTINSMVGMGIVSLPGMMTGQILAGTMPLTAILYQISMMIAICTSVTAACFSSLYMGYKTLYDPATQIISL